MCLVVAIAATASAVYARRGRVRYVRVVVNEAPESEIEREYDERRYDVEEKRYEYVTVEDVDDERRRIARVLASTATTTTTIRVVPRRRHRECLRRVHESNVQLAIVLSYRPCYCHTFIY